MNLEPRPSDTFQPGDLLNNTYRVNGILGRGGTSEVYLATSEISGRKVALKVLNATLSKNDDNLLLMTREEEIRDVRHDAVVRYSENNRTPDNHVYLVMDHVDGPRLDEFMSQHELSVDDLMAIGRRVAGGLVATHARKIIHRDLSPDNIILRNGNPAEAVIIDFGIARDTNVGAATIVGDGFAGKYAYAAPEQLSGQSDERTDLYSLGALLLAAYEGKSPSLGSNLLEIVEAKKLPLDTSGVPEPLRSLIDRLAAPDPDDRPATAAEALSLLGGDDAPEAGMSGATVADSTLVGIGSERRVPAPSKQAGGSSSKTWLLVVGAIVLVAAGGAGAYFAGLFGASYPPADPYSLEIVRQPDAPPRMTGFAPSEGVKQRFETAMADLGGVASIDLASGDLPDAWGEGVIGLIDALSGLGDWTMRLDGGRIQVEGIARSGPHRDELESRFSPSALPAGFSGEANFLVGPRQLPVDDVRSILGVLADCGRLTLVDPPPSSYALGQRIIVEGALSGHEKADEVFLALTETAGDRQVLLDTKLLNEQLCAVEEKLADLVVESSGVSTFVPGRALEFSEGLTGESRPDARFSEGENPVIDLILPADMVEGYLWVAIVDVTGSVFHLLPNIRNPDHDVASIRANSGDRLRLSHPVGSQGKTVFTVDANSGKSNVMVFHSSVPLFEAPRPTTESIAAFSEAIERRVTSEDVKIYALAEDIIETD